MPPHETVSTTTPGDARATAPLTRTFGPQGPTLGDLSDAYLQDYQVRQFRSHSTARGRTAHLTAFFGRAARAAALTTHQIRQYQLARRAAGAATGTINRETSALHRMGTLAVHWGWLDTVPGFPDRLRENPPRQGFFEHPEYLAVRAHLPAPWQDILDLAYYSGWRKNEILGLTWEEIDMAGGVIRLSPARSKTLVGRILPISPPIAEALARRRARRDPDSPLVFHRDGIPVRGIIKLTKSSSIDPQDTGLEPAVNTPCWASRTAVGLNLTIPSWHIITVRVCVVARIARVCRTPARFHRPA